MSGITKREAGLVLVAINAAFPARFPLPTELKAKETIVGVWYSVLADLPANAAVAAAHAALTEATHPPTPAEVRRKALGRVLEAPAGADAWGEVCKAIARWGRSRYEEARGRFSTPAIAVSVDAMGGWAALCGSENTTADRARFVEHFDGQIERARSAVMTGQAKSIAAAIGDRQERLGTGKRRGSAAIGELLAKGAS